MGKRLASVVGIALVIVLVGACSGDKGDDSITKEQYLEQATVICEEARQAIDDARPTANEADPNTAMYKFVQQASTEILGEIQQLRDLGFPEGDEQTLNKAFAVYEKTFETLQNDPSGAASIADDKELIAAGKVLEDYGLPACGADI